MTDLRQSRLTRMLVWVGSRSPVVRRWIMRRAWDDLQEARDA